MYSWAKYNMKRVTFANLGLIVHKLKVVRLSDVIMSTGVWIFCYQVSMMNIVLSESLGTRGMQIQLQLLIVTACLKVKTG